MNSIKIFLLISLTALSAGFTNLYSQGPDKPNIVLILTDDQGHGDLGYHGNPLIKTPVLDSLARRSARFTHFYVSPVCAPTRASLMTGRYSLRTGVYDTYRGGAIMATEERTIAEELQERGYRTGIFGKWHLGDNYPYRPQDQGFETTLIHSGGGLEQPGDFYGNFIRKGFSYFDPILLKNGKQYQAKGYCSDVYTDAAIDFVESHSEEPFFLYLAFNAPHTPLEVPEEYYALYKNMDYNTDTFAIQGSNEFDRMTEKDVEDARKAYAMITNIDDNVGRLLAVLENQGLSENTLVIFITDNGPQQRRYKSGLYGRKGSVYEGGIRVPSFWFYPKAFGENRDISVPAAHIDVLPTLLQLLGEKPSADVDGISLLPLLRGEAKQLTSRNLYFQWMRGYPRPFHNMAVCTDSFKLTGAYFFEKYPDDFQLFDLRKDPFETTDIKDQHPETMEAMAEDYRDWLDEMKASPHLRTPRYIHLPAPDEDTTRLNRNDWKGPHTQNWGAIEAQGYWDVEVTEAGSYDIELFFQDTLPGNGQVSLRIGPEDRIIRVDNDARQSYTFTLPLKKGEYMLEPWFYCYWPEEAKGIYGPYEVRVMYRGR